MRLAEVAARLLAGESVTFRPSGHSMTPIIHHRQAVTVTPTGDATVQERDVVLVKVRGAWLLHRVQRATPDRLLIANARGRENGWVRRGAVAGRVSQIHP